MDDPGKDLILNVALAVAYDAATAAVARATLFSTFAISAERAGDDSPARWPTLGAGGFDVAHYEALGAFVRDGGGQIKGETIHRWLGGRGLHACDPARYGDPGEPASGAWMVAHEIFAAVLPVVDRVMLDAYARIKAATAVVAPPPLAGALTLPVDETTLEQVSGAGELLDGYRITLTDAGDDEAPMTDEERAKLSEILSAGLAAPAAVVIDALVDAGPAKLAEVAHAAGADNVVVSTGTIDVELDDDGRVLSIGEVKVDHAEGEGDAGGATDVGVERAGLETSDTVVADQDVPAVGPGADDAVPQRDEVGDAASTAEEPAATDASAPEGNARVPSAGADVAAQPVTPPKRKASRAKR